MAEILELLSQIEENLEKMNRDIKEHQEFLEYDMIHTYLLNSNPEDITK